MPFKRYKNLREATLSLRKKGYIHTFNFTSRGLICLQTGMTYRANDMYIAENQRFKSKKGTDSTSVIFAIECKDGIKGILVSTTEMYYDIPLIRFINKVKVKTSKPNPAGK